MNVVDSSAWLEFLGDGPNASHFAKVIEKPSELVVPTLTIFEVFKRTLQLKGEPAALDAAATMLQGEVVDLSSSIAIDAARLSAELKLPLADSVILATARAREAVLWTQDAHFEGMANIEYRKAKPQKAG
jgi:predicted nucleic acid-binding protein